MDGIDALTFPATAREAEYLEDTSLARLILEHYDQDNGEKTKRFLQSGGHAASPATVCQTRAME